MVVSGGSIAQWLTFGIENEGVFYTFVYAAARPSLFVWRRLAGSSHSAWRLARVAGSGHSPAWPGYGKGRYG
jgi:hypothetical protein